jgi:hypothetical protein
MCAIIFFLVVLAISCQAQIPATVEILEDTTAVKYHVFVWEGDAVNNPLVEDSSFTYILSLGLTHYEITATALQFDTDVNGNYIQIAAFNENGAGMTAGATLSDLILKPSEANKSVIIEFKVGL